MDLAELTPFAIRLAHHIAHLSSSGLADPMNWGELAERFTDEDRSHMVEAAFELQDAGLITVSGALNVPDGISHIRPAYDLYWQFDPEIFNVDVGKDIVTLIRLILEDEALGNAARLQERVGWSLRRFNPPFARVVQEFPEGRVSGECQADYPSRYVAVMPEDRARLRRLLEVIAAEEDQGEPERQAEPVPNRPENSGKLTLNLGFFQTEFHASRSVIGGVVAIAALILLFWQWPAIANRFGLGLSNRHPALVSPSDAVTLTPYPRHITFIWKALPGAARYIVELEAQDPATGTWFPHPHDAKSVATDTSLTLEFIGDQPGRWRVIAINEDGVRSKPSAWNEFFYESEPSTEKP
tara:strand:+ start:24246 stop:25307 length:1062 start_codon:yes stop_codon:yes gene_type:complete